MSFPDTRQQITLSGDTYTIYNIAELDMEGVADIGKLPFSIRILLENLLRHRGSAGVTEEHILDTARWASQKSGKEPVMIPYYPSRVLMQDFTGVPAVVDLAAMRDAVAEAGGNPDTINPLVPVDLVIDHSVQVDFQARKDAAELNVEKEYHRNTERYKLLKWAQKSFNNFRVVPPGSGICHQVNLEYLAEVVKLSGAGDCREAFPDTLVGTDSHTTMINGLGVLGWGVGGIEAEAVMLGQPYFMTLPEVVGVRFLNEPAPGVTATDIVLAVTQVLRKANVVEKFVEFTGPGMKRLSLTDRATIANMAPEYGATIGFFPVDEQTIDYLVLTGRKDKAAAVEKYCRTCRMFYQGTEDLSFTRTVDIDLAGIRPSVAGPARPQDRISLTDVKAAFVKGNTGALHEASHAPQVPEDLRNGSVVIAAITSCTNTSNPLVMLGAGLAARNAVSRGLGISSMVKTSLSPGSRVVVDYLTHAGLMPSLEALGFHVAGFGCMTCIGNSGPLDPAVERVIREKELNVVSVLSGNRNFEARIHQSTRSNYLMSPILVVMYALAGRIDIDFDIEPLGVGKDGHPVFMADIWPDDREIRNLAARHVKPEFFTDQYSAIFKGDHFWKELAVKQSQTFAWDPGSQYIRRPPFFEAFSQVPEKPSDIVKARALLVLGDSVTTDHISPAGAIPKAYPAGVYLTRHGVNPKDFNSYGSRRGNHEVMIRGTFGNIRIRNRLVDEAGSFTRKFPENSQTSVFEASMAYQQESVPLIVLGGREYGTGSSRDWAAKGTSLLGVKAVIAISFERIHRSNLVGMGVLPLVLKDTAFEDLGLSGQETFDIHGIQTMAPGSELRVTARRDDGKTVDFKVISRLDTDVELAYFNNGGILQYVLRQMLAARA
ncbi:MAG: aconitate hydratase AcnA [Pseudomonadota bacterium]